MLGPETFEAALNTARNELQNVAKYLPDAFTTPGERENCRMLLKDIIKTATKLAASEDLREGSKTVRANDAEWKKLSEHEAAV